MRHRKAGIKLNRTTSHREAMFRNMVTSLFKYDRIRTTDAKAKELRRLADNMVTLAKRGDLHARRQALAVIRERPVVHKLFESANERFGNVNGGYTRVVKLGRRPGDSAPISIVELVAMEAEKKKAKKKKSDGAKAKDTPTADVKVDTKGKQTAESKKPETETSQPLKEEGLADGAEERAEDIKNAAPSEDAAAVTEGPGADPGTVQTEEAVADKND